MSDYIEYNISSLKEVLHARKLIYIYLNKRAKGKKKSEKQDRIGIIRRLILQQPKDIRLLNDELKRSRFIYVIALHSILNRLELKTLELPFNSKYFTDSIQARESQLRHDYNLPYVNIYPHHFTVLNLSTLTRDELSSVNLELYKRYDDHSLPMFKCYGTDFDYSFHSLCYKQCFKCSMLDTIVDIK